MYSIKMYEKQVTKVNNVEKTKNQLNNGKPMNEPNIHKKLKTTTTTSDNNNCIWALNVIALVSLPATRPKIALKSRFE